MMYTAGQRRLRIQRAWSELDAAARHWASMYLIEINSALARARLRQAAFEYTAAEESIPRAKSDCAPKRRRRRTK